LKKIDLGQTVQLVANIGVIAGIIFLAFELRQNNELLTAQASFGQFEIERERRNRLIENTGGIADVLRKSHNSVPLSDVEEFRVGIYYEDLVASWTWQFREVQEGRLADDFLDLSNVRGIWRANPGLAGYVESRETRLDPEFVRYLQENVIEQ